MAKDDPITLYCLNILSRDDVKTKIKCLFTPIIDMVLIEVYPYVLISILKHLYNTSTSLEAS